MKSSNTARNEALGTKKDLSTVIVLRSFGVIRNGQS